MIPPAQAYATLQDEIAEIEEKVRCRLMGRLYGFSLARCDSGLVLRGKASTFYVKQLALHAVLENTRDAIQSNEIEVSAEPKVSRP